MSCKALNIIKETKLAGIEMAFVSTEIMDKIRQELWELDPNLQELYISHKTMPPIYSLYGVEIGLLPDSYNDN